jgi:hypothetical protein
MPLQRVGPDSNGLYYQALTSSEWQGALGVQLRSQGYRYCGFGTWGVYVAGPGQECTSKDLGGVQPPPPGPYILPMIQPPPETTGGVGSTPAPVHVGGCGCGSKGPEAVTQPAQPGAAPVIPAGPVSTVSATHVSAVMVLDRLKGLPWWVYVLALLAAAHFVSRGQARG